MDTFSLANIQVGSVVRDNTGTDFVVLRWERQKGREVNVSLLPLTGDVAGAISGVKPVSELRDLSYVQVRTPINPTEQHLLHLYGRGDYQAAAQFQAAHSEGLLTRGAPSSSSSLSDRIPIGRTGESLVINPAASAMEQEQVHEILKRQYPHVYSDPIKRESVLRVLQDMRARQLAAHVTSPISASPNHNTSLHANDVVPTHSPAVRAPLPGLHPAKDQKGLQALLQALYNPESEGVRHAIDEATAPLPTIDSSVDVMEAAMEIARTRREHGITAGSASPLAPSVTQRNQLVRRARLGLASDAEIASLIPSELRQSLGHQGTQVEVQRIKATIAGTLGVGGTKAEEHIRGALGRWDWKDTADGLIHMEQTTQSVAQGGMLWDARLGRSAGPGFRGRARQDEIEGAISSILDEVFMAFAETHQLKIPGAGATSTAVPSIMTMQERLKIRRTEIIETLNRLTFLDPKQSPIDYRKGATSLRAHLNSIPDLRSNDFPPQVRNDLSRGVISPGTMDYLGGLFQLGKDPTSGRWYTPVTSPHFEFDPLEGRDILRARQERLRELHGVGMEYSQKLHHYSTGANYATKSERGGGVLGLGRVEEIFDRLGGADPNQVWEELPAIYRGAVNRGERAFLTREQLLNIVQGIEVGQIQESALNSLGLTKLKGLAGFEYVDWRRGKMHTVHAALAREIARHNDLSVAALKADINANEIHLNAWDVAFPDLQQASWGRTADATGVFGIFGEGMGVDAFGEDTDHTAYHGLTGDEWTMVGGGRHRAEEQRISAAHGRIRTIRTTEPWIPATASHDSVPKILLDEITRLRHAHASLEEALPESRAELLKIKEDISRLQGHLDSISEVLQPPAMVKALNATSLQSEKEFQAIKNAGLPQQRIDPKTGLLYETRVTQTNAGLIDTASARVLTLSEMLKSRGALKDQRYTLEIPAHGITPELREADSQEIIDKFVRTRERAEDIAASADVIAKGITEQPLDKIGTWRENIEFGGKTYRSSEELARLFQSKEAKGLIESRLRSKIARAGIDDIEDLTQEVLVEMAMRGGSLTHLKGFLAGVGPTEGHLEAFVAQAVNKVAGATNAKRKESIDQLTSYSLDQTAHDIIQDNNADVDPVARAVRSTEKEYESILRKRIHQQMLDGGELAPRVLEDGRTLGVKVGSLESGASGPIDTIATAKGHVLGEIQRWRQEVLDRRVKHQDAIDQIDERIRSIDETTQAAAELTSLTTRRSQHVKSMAEAEEELGHLRNLSKSFELRGEGLLRDNDPLNFVPHSINNYSLMEHLENMEDFGVTDMTLRVETPDGGTLRLPLHKAPIGDIIGTGTVGGATKDDTHSITDRTAAQGMKLSEGESVGGGVKAASSTSQIRHVYVAKLPDGSSVVVDNIDPIRNLTGLQHAQLIPLESQSLRSNPLPPEANLPIWRKNNRFVGIQGEMGHGDLFQNQVAALASVHTGGKKVLMLDMETIAGQSYDYPWQIGLSILDPKTGVVSPVQNQHFKGGLLGFDHTKVAGEALWEESNEIVGKAQRTIQGLMKTGDYILATAGEAVDLPKMGLGNLQPGSLNINFAEQMAAGLEYRPSVEATAWRTGALSLGAAQTHNAVEDTILQNQIVNRRLPTWAAAVNPEGWEQTTVGDFTGQIIGLRQGSSNTNLGLPKRITSGREYRVQGIVESPGLEHGMGSLYQLHLQPVEARLTSTGTYEIVDVGTSFHTKARPAAFFAGELQQAEVLGSAEEIFQRQKLIAEHEANRRIHRILTGEFAGDKTNPMGGIQEIYDLVTGFGSDASPEAIIEALSRVDPDRLGTDLEKRTRYYRDQVQNDPRFRRQWEAMKDFLGGDYKDLHQGFLEELSKENLSPAEQRALLKWRHNELYGEGGILAVRSPVPQDPLGRDITPRPSTMNPLLENMASIQTGTPQAIERSLQETALDVVRRGYTGHDQFNLLQQLGVDPEAARRVVALNGQWTDENISAALGTEKARAFKSAVAEMALNRNIAVGHDIPQTLGDVIQSTFEVGGSSPNIRTGNGDLMRLDALAQALHTFRNENYTPLSQKTGTQWLVDSSNQWGAAAIDEVEAVNRRTLDIVRLDRGERAVPLGTPRLARLVRQAQSGEEIANQLVFTINQGFSRSEPSEFTMNVAGMTPKQVIESHGERGHYILGQLVARDEDPNSKVHLNDDQHREILSILGWNQDPEKMDRSKFIIPLRKTKDGQPAYTITTLADLVRRNDTHMSAMRELGINTANQPELVWDALNSAYGGSRAANPILPVSLPGDTAGALQTGANVVGDAAQNAAEHTNTGAADAAAQATAQAAAGASVGAPQPVVPAQIGQAIADATNLGGVGNAARAAGGQIPHATTPIGQSLNSVEHGNAMIAGVLAVGGILMLAGMKNYNRDPREDEKTDRAAILGQKPVFNNPNITNLNFKVNGVIRATAPDQIDHNTVLDAVHSAMAGFTNEQTSVKRSNSVNDHRDPMDRLPIHGMHRALNMVARKVM